MLTRSVRSRAFIKGRTQHREEHARIRCGPARHYGCAGDRSMDPELVGRETRPLIAACNPSRNELGRTRNDGDFKVSPCKRGHTAGRYKGNGSCKECSRAASRLYYVNNRERVLELLSRFPLDVRQRRARDGDLKRKYGISLDQFDIMFDRQRRGCAICNTPNAGQRGWSVDHCHVTGAVRGILCNNCNPMLGHAKDSALTLSAAISYLAGERDRNSLNAVLSFGC